MKKSLGFLVVVVVLCFTSVAFADSFSLYSSGENFVTATGDPSHPVAFELVSDTSAGHPGYGGMYYTSDPGFTIADLSTLSADYEMLDGTFVGGSPRFTLFDDMDRAAYLYFGTGTSGCSMTDPNAGNPSFANTGNVVASGELRVASNGFGGYNNPNQCVSFASFLASVAGTTPLAFITLDLDAGFAGRQAAYVDNFTVNDNVFSAADQVTAVPEPSSMILLASGGLTFVGAIRRKLRK